MADAYYADRQQPGRRLPRQERRPAAAGRARPLRAGRTADRRHASSSAPRPAVAAATPSPRSSRRRPQVDSRLDDEVRAALGGASVDAGIWNDEAPGSQRWKALVFDATGIANSAELRELWRFFHPTIRRLEPSGRADRARRASPATARIPRAATAQRALEGFVRAAGKELRYGGTAQLLHVAPGCRGPARLQPPLLPLAALGLRLRPGRRGSATGARRARDRPRAAAARQGRARHRRLARDRRGDRRRRSPATAPTSSASTCPPLEDDLERVVGALGGSAIVADITAADAPAAICDALAAEHGGVDVVVHNAGVTRDKTLGGMDADRWDLRSRST